MEDLPVDYLDNEYIKTGYRINCHTNRNICCSLFKCHNETFNIWSHLLGKIAYLSMFLFITLYYSNQYARGYQGVVEFENENNDGQEISWYLGQK